MLTWIVVGLLVALVFLFVLNPRSLRRLWGAASVQAGKVGRWASESDPLAVYKERVDNGVDNIAKAKKSLEGVATMVRSVTRQVEDGKKEQIRLSSRISAIVANGDKNDTATDYALQLAQVEKDLARNEDQLLKHKETYENFKQMVIINQRKVEEARREAASLGLALEQSEREKEFVQFAHEFENAKFNSDGLASAKEAVQQKIDANRAAGDVARDLSRSSAAEAADEALEQKADAEAILARFKKPAE